MEAIGLVLAAGGGSSAVPAGSAVAPASSAHRCQPGFKHAVIAGRHRCLKVGRRCNPAHDRQYHRHGFHCHSGRLIRRRPPAPPAPPPPTPIGADLSITLVDAPDPVTAGTTLTYTLTARNEGPSAATDVIVGDFVAPDLPVAIASFSASQGTCTSLNATTAACLLGTLAVGATATMTVLVTPMAPGTLSNRAAVTSETMLDPDLVNNSATTVTTVTAPPPPPPTPPPPPPPPAANCHASYPDVCIPPPPPDLDCGDVPHRNFRVLHTVADPDPHRFDGDRDGFGCEE